MTNIKEEGEQMSNVKKTNYIDEIDRTKPDGTFMVDDNGVKYVMKNGTFVKHEEE